MYEIARFCDFVPSLPFPPRSFRFPRDTTQSAVLSRQVVRPSVCDVKVKQAAKIHKTHQCTQLRTGI